MLSERIGHARSITLDGDDGAQHARPHPGAAIDVDTYITDVTLAEDDTGLDITIVHRHRGPGRRPRGGDQAGALHPAHRPSRHRGQADRSISRRSGGSWPASTEVPGFGWPGSNPRRSPTRSGWRRTRRRAGRRSPVAPSTNGLVTVAVDPADGTFAVDGVPGYGRLVDGGDHGDTYNYSPPIRDRWSTGPTRSRWRSGTGDRSGPPSTITLHLHLARPGGRGRHARVGRPRRSPVTTTLEVRADEPVVRVHTEFVNPSRDHRLRVHLPLPRPAATSRAECAFAVVERGLDRRGPTGGVRAAHLPLPPLRLQRRADRGPRGAARVRAGGHRPRTTGTGRPGPPAGPHPAAGHRACCRGWACPPARSAPDR